MAKTSSYGLDLALIVLRRKKLFQRRKRRRKREFPEIRAEPRRSIDMFHVEHICLSEPMATVCFVCKKGNSSFRPGPAAETGRFFSPASFAGIF